MSVRVRAVVWVLALVCVGGSARAQIPSGETRYPTDEDTALAAEVLDLLNQARDEQGIAVLIANPQLDLVAYQHAAEMARRGQVSHHSFDFAVSTATRIHLAFPRVLQFAENVAMNGTPAALNRALLVSPGHRRNRMERSFTHVGIGVARADSHRLYLAELYVRVTNPEIIAEIDVLYNEADPETRPREDAHHGTVTGETITLSRPGDDDPEYWTQLGIEAYIGQRFDEAAAHFRHALELDPTYLYALFDLGRALLGAGEAAEALVVLGRYLEFHPDDPDALRSTGAAALLLQDYARAERTFRAVLAVRTRDAGSWYNLGLALEFQDRPSVAENAYAQALHLDPTLVAAAAGLARVQR